MKELKEKLDVAKLTFELNAWDLEKATTFNLIISFLMILD